MEFIDKHKALIITSMLMGIVVLSLYNINMMHKQKKQSEILMEIPEEFLLKEEEQAEEDPIAQKERNLIASKRTHSAYNEDFEDPDEFEERIKSLTETESETSAEESEEEKVIEGEALIDKKKETESEKKSKPEIENKEANNKNTSLSFSLKDRTSIDLPNPVYTCNGSGKVIVKIEVNQNGYVINTKVDKKNSTTRNECLFDNALDYARHALFSRSDIEKQEGSITYYFNYGD